MSVDDCDVGLCEQVAAAAAPPSPPPLLQPSNLAFPSPCDGEVPQIKSLSVAGPGQGFVANIKIAAEFQPRIEPGSNAEVGDGTANPSSGPEEEIQGDVRGLSYSPSIPA